ncbi:hypothetical protein BD779DRAFT_1704003 [Infundibulicybe gibba]|nr:hypothetical protein BD779DRAFT_1704003 [Infundibulicybe gibba]
MSDSAPQVEPTFGETWDVVVALYLVSAVFTGCISMQACTYFHKFFHRDRNILKYTVAYIWFGCMIITVCEFWVIHGIIITGYLLPSEEVVISLGLPIALAVGITIICVTQGIYVLRMYRFSHNRYLLACCCVLVGVELGTGFAWTRRAAYAAPAWQHAAQQSRWIVTTTYAIGMVLDIFIAASMCYQLWRRRMIGLKRTRHLVDTLMRWTIHERDFKHRGHRRCPHGLTNLNEAHLTNFHTDSVRPCNGNRLPCAYFLEFGADAISRTAAYAMGLLALLNARTRLDELDTDHLCLPTATISLEWARTSKSAGIPVAHSVTTGSTQGGMVHDSGLP